MPKKKNPAKSQLIAEQRRRQGLHEARIKADRDHSSSRFLLCANADKTTSLLFVLLILGSHVASASAAIESQRTKEMRRDASKICREKTKELTVQNRPPSGRVTVYQGRAMPFCYARIAEQLSRSGNLQEIQISASDQCSEELEKFNTWSSQYLSMDKTAFLEWRSELEAHQIQISETQTEIYNIFREQILAEAQEKVKTLTSRTQFDHLQRMTDERVQKLSHVMQQLLKIKRIMYQAAEIKKQGQARCGEYSFSSIADLLKHFSDRGQTIKIQLLTAEAHPSADHVFLLLNSSLDDVSIKPKDSSDAAKKLAAEEIARLKLDGDICDPWNIQTDGQGFYRRASLTDDPLYDERANWDSLRLESISLNFDVKGLPHYVVKHIDDQLASVGLQRFTPSGMPVRKQSDTTRDMDSSCSQDGRCVRHYKK